MNNPIKKLVERIIHQGLESFGRHYSMYRGYVLNNNDPSELNKLFVQVPHISGIKKEGNWAYPKGLPNELNLLPKVGDMVWVEFEYGDYRYPVWSYSNQIKEVRQKTNPVVKPGDLKWKTERGHHISIEGDIIELKHKNGSNIQLNEESVTIDSKTKVIIKNEENDLKTLLNQLISELRDIRIQTGVGPALPFPEHIQKFQSLITDLNNLMD